MNQQQPWRGQPQYGPPPQYQQYHRFPPPPRKRGNRGLIVLVVAVTLLAAAAGGYFLFFAGGGGGSGGGTAADQDYDATVREHGAAEVAWRVAQGGAADQAVANGAWLTGEHLVRRLPGRVVAYDLSSGDEAWAFPLDDPPKDNCKSSREQSGNRVALLRSVGEGQPRTKSRAGTPGGCGKLTVLDLGTGKEVFTADLAPDADKKLPDTMARPVLTADRVVVDTAPGRVFDLAGGAEVPVPPAFAGCTAPSLGLFGDVLLADSTCPGNTEDRDHKNDELRTLRAYDANFALKWEWKTPKDDKGEPLPVRGVLSVDPLVVEVGHSGHETRLLAVDPASGAAKPFAAYKTDTRGEFKYACAGQGLRDCPAAKVVGGKVILSTSPVQVNPGDPDAGGAQATEFRNELVALDIATGDAAWRTGKVAGRALAMVPTDDNRLIAFQPENPNGAKAMVFSVNPADGKATPVLAIGPAALADDKLNKVLRNQSFGGGGESDALWRDGLLIVIRTVYRPATAVEISTVAFRGK
ncbi:hypothetical protein [Amycolatopsis eburnea]|uniref:Pyrrolo-quinoline quinone repeat domain-containing protein n=1 Tax=Amycolatopsis eburnea TaxID=2267691 RepID=A0A427SX79_9PSEU|nr:hypothetical protein [Amycolatopsis eburnea]RSD09205.1 hypothetical protein EIY87_39795 [Amycolatopsis eburnea]